MLFCCIVEYTRCLNSNSLHLSMNMWKVKHNNLMKQLLEYSCIWKVWAVITNGNNRQLTPSKNTTQQTAAHFLNWLLPGCPSTGNGDRHNEVGDNNKHCFSVPWFKTVNSSPKHALITIKKYYHYFRTHPEIEDTYYIMRLCLLDPNTYAIFRYALSSTFV